ncbi:hypothetical protein L7F22_018003 [Adiantum nelumboides]|nr:hypothetical protein [Adiantum nelumboides]
MVKTLSMTAFLLLAQLLSLCFLPFSCSSSSRSYVSFSLTHRDAESSLLRVKEADSSDMPTSEKIPMRDFVVAGRAMRGRIEKQREPIVGRFSYLRENVGEFYLTMSVGNPPQKLIFTLDTGSELTWTECKPCKVCSKSGSPTFAFNKSSSYLPVPCSSSLCIQSLGFTSGGGCNNSTGNCMFQLLYGDGSVDAGFVSVDSFDLGHKLSKSIVFGCVVINMDTVPLPSSGIMGLNAGPFSFTSQLLGKNPALPNRFAYCLPDRFKHLNSQGTIMFGEYTLPSSMRYTPLVPPYGPLGNLYYFVKLEDISVGKMFIKPTRTMNHKGLQIGGTIFDSGTVLTHLEKSLYVEMVAEMRRQTMHLHPFSAKGSASDLCYAIPLSAKELPKVPLITLHFAGKVGMELRPESVLYPIDIDGKSITLCLAFRSSQASMPLNIIGNYQQQNYWVEHNLQTSSIGLAKANCVKGR